MAHHLSLFSRLTASSHRLDASETQAEVERLSCAPLSELHRGEVATVAGRIRSVVYTPRENNPTLTADLYDGTASITLVWLGQRRIAGVVPGRRLIARGRIGEHEGDPAIYNPWYELQRVL